MQKFSLLLPFLVLITSVSHAGDIDFSGYFRAPFGANLQGGKQIQLINPGTAGNEFRLGNEVGYGELNFLGHVVKVKPETGDLRMDAIFTFAIFPGLNTQYGDATGGNGSSQIVQAFLEGQFDSSMEFWAGKRFYRWGYVVMDDFFYFADMSGNGVGLDKIKTSFGELAIALLQFTDTTITGSTGNPAKDALDLRLKKIDLNATNNLDLWLTYAISGAGNGVNSSNVAVAYAESTGGALGLRWNHIFPRATNEASIQIGNGVMESLNLAADAAATSSASISGYRVRLVDTLDTPIDSVWAIRSGLIADVLNYNSSTQVQKRWNSIGLRPSYQWSDHLQFLLDAGYSTITDDTDGLGAKTLTRFTFGPQWGVGKGLTANPVVRATVSTTFWNGANGTLNTTSSLVGAYNAANSGATVLNGKTQLTQLGVEAEMSF